MDTTTSKISVLMPAYNAEKYISEAIESILCQTFKDFELIILDDGSSDTTVAIAEKYARADSRVRLFKNEKNLGISATRNKLISLSKAKYIAWQDADDISMPYRLEHQYEYMEVNPEVGISAGYLEFFSEKGNISIRKYAPDDKTLRARIFRYSPCPQPAAIIRRECFATVGDLPALSSGAEDLAMSFQIGTKYKFGNLQEILVKYREIETGATHTKLKLMELYTIYLRYYFHNRGYRMTMTDRIYTLVEYLTAPFFSPHFKIKVFNLLRNSRKS